MSINEQSLYENIIKKLEAKERYLNKLTFQNKLQKDAMENKIGEYMEMEEEFEEMKTKLKYEDGRFLNNDRKDNEIIIIRGENSNLKQTIKKLEEQLNDLEVEKEKNKKLIEQYENSVRQMKIKIEELQKQNEILNAHNINININNVTGPNNKNNLMHNTNNINHSSNKYIFNCNNEINNGFNRDGQSIRRNSDNKSKYFPYKKVKTKILNNKNKMAEMADNTRNESTDKNKTDFLEKFFTGNKINKNNNNNLNNSCAKMNHFPLGNNYIKSNNSYIPIFNRNMNYNIMKKIISSGGNSSRAYSTKIKGKPHADINYKSMS